jgi:phage baseplate assembly protein gpV
VVVFHPETGAEIHFLASGDVEVTSPTRVKVTAPLVDVVSAIKATVTAPLVDVVSATKVTITAPAAEVVGNLTVTGNLVVTGTATNLGVNIGSTHVHGGVTAGAGVSGVPQ